MLLVWANLNGDEKVAAIKQVWEPDFSASDIATALGTIIGDKVTRNSVIGLYHRQAANAAKDRRPDPLIDHPLRNREVNAIIRDRERRIAHKEKMRRKAEQQREARNRKQALTDRPRRPPGQPTDDRIIAEPAPGSLIGFHTPVTIANEGYGVPMDQTTGCKWPTQEHGRSHLFCNHTPKRRPTVIGGVEAFINQPYCERHTERASGGFPPPRKVASR